MKSQLNKTKVNTAVELLLGLDVAGSLKRREDQLRRTAGDLHTGVARSVDVGGGILELLL